MTGYYREIKSRYYDSDLMNYIYFTRVEAVITNDISKYNYRKKIKFKEIPGALGDWYEFIMNGIDDYYVDVERVYMWRKGFHEQ